MREITRVPRAFIIRSLLVFLLILGVGWLGSARGVHAQEPGSPAKKAPPPAEEEEGDPKKPLKKIPVEGDPPAPPQQNPNPMPPGNTPPTTPPIPPMNPMTPGGIPQPMNPMTPGSTPPEQEEGDQGVYYVRIDDLVRATTAATNPALKQFFKSLSVAHDRLHHVNFRILRVTPVPLRWGKDRFPPEFGVALLNPDDTAGDVQPLQPKFVSDLVPFELVAVERVTEFLKPSPPTPDAPKVAEKLAAAERALTAVLFFHDSARDQNRRRGKNWDPVKTTLYDKLTEVRIERVKQIATEQDWPRLKELSTRLIELYRANPKILEPVFAARLAEAEVLIKSKNITEMERGRELLNDYEARYPNTGNATAKRIRVVLAERAKQFLSDAQRQMAGNQAEARNLLKTVEAIDPENASLRQMQQQLKVGYPTLVIGTRRLPELMSPTRARFDSEQQAVELLFEGLLEAVPDELTGVRFRPILAAERPLVGAGVRDIQLMRTAEWSGPDRGMFDSSDVAGTLRLFRQAPSSWAADLTRWLDEPVFDPSDPGHIRMRYKLGHPDPRQPLTLKLHPARWLLEKNKGIDDLEFARKPFGTGPFRLPANHRPPQVGEPPRDVVFLANPAYGRRPGRTGQPFIKEVRFTDVTQYPDILAELRADRLHILTNVPTAELPKYSANSGLNGRVRVVTNSTNRREHILAINHRRPQLQNVDVRRGLSHAIDRERILNEVYRAGQSQYHKVLTGPFPEGSWATPRTLGTAGLYNRDIAQGRLRQYLSNPGATSSLSLLCTDDDPDAKMACEKIKGMIESATNSEERRLTIVIEPVSPRELLRRVEELQNYDLAYLPIDFRDDWYPLALGSFLDPNATGPLGRNYLGYLSKESRPTDVDDQLARLLAECRLYRDMGKLTSLAHEIHRRFNETIPFIPLWQIDHHMVVSTAVKVYLEGQVEEASPRLLNPTTLLSSIGRWRVE